MKYKYFFITLLIILSGCGDTKQPIRVGINLWPGYEPAYIAKRLNFYDGKRVKVVEYVSSVEVMRAFKNNSIDLAALTLDEVFSLQMKEPISIVLVADVSVGGDAILARKNSNIKNIQDLKGKKIAVELNAVGEYFLYSALKANGVNKSEVHLVNQNVYSHESLENQKEVDAIVSYEPILKKMKEKFKVIFTSKEIPDKVMDVVIARDGIDENRLKEFYDGWFQGVDLILNQPEKSYPVMKENLKISHDEIKIILEGLKILNREESENLLNDEGRLKEVIENVKGYFIENDRISEKKVNEVIKKISPINKYYE